MLLYVRHLYNKIILFVLFLLTCISNMTLLIGVRSKLNFYLQHDTTICFVN